LHSRRNCPIKRILRFGPTQKALTEPIDATTIDKPANCLDGFFLIGISN
jgi:hypothetical protein